MGKIRPVTFMSQKTDELIITVVNQGRKIRRPAVKTTRTVPYGQAAHSGDRREQGETHEVAHRLVSGTPKILNLKDIIPILIVF
jgi:hypothetical protein